MTTVADPAALLPEWARNAADDVDLQALEEVVVERDLDAAFPQLAVNREFVDRLRASVRENLRALQAVLTGRIALDEVRLDEPLVFATVQARLRVPQTALQQSYRVGFAVMWEEWAGRLSVRAEEGDIPRVEALHALRTLTRAILGYQHHVASHVAESYARADEALSRSRAHVRNGLVRQLLRGEDHPLSHADVVTLGYPLPAHHVAVLLPTLAEGAAERLVASLRTAARATDALVHPVNLSGSVIWLGNASGWAAEATSAVLAQLTTLDVQATVSEPRSGLAGFRETWQQVLQVQQIRDAWGPSRAPRVLCHADVALEILLMQDPARARSFVLRELGPLGEGTEQAERLRETVQASFQLGSHVATAEHLHLHEHTVRNRLQKAEELLGRPLHCRRTELQVALRLIGVLEPGERPFFAINHP